MQNDQQTLKAYLIETGLWSEQDGVFGTDEHSCGLVLERVQQKFSYGVFLMFYRTGETNHEARVLWDGQQQTIATGESMADTVWKAALALPSFLKDYPHCAASSQATLIPQQSFRTPLEI